MPETKGYHAHVYFDADTIQGARRFCIGMRDKFGVTMGRARERPVGAG